MDYLAEVKPFYAEAVAPYKGEPIGCSPEEVALLEQQIGFALPEAYQQYLLWMGRDYRGIFQGSDWFITDVQDNTAYLPELLAENQVSCQLAPHYLVFFGHQGYMAAWFNLPKESENPTAYFFSEGQDNKEPVVAGNFTDMLLKDMQGLAALLPSLYRRRD